MKQEQLNKESHANLDKLMQFISEALKSQEDNPHLSAVSTSNFDLDSPLVFHGGGLVAPGKPQFDYEEKELKQLHRAFLKSAKEVYRLIITGTRPDDQAEWTLAAKLVSQDEQKALMAAVKPLSAQIEAELRTVNYKGKLDYLSFRRSDAPPNVGLSLVGKPLQRLPPSAKLLELLAQVDKIYETAGLKLASCDWSLESGGFEYTEYYE